MQLTIYDHCARRVPRVNVFEIPRLLYILEKCSRSYRLSQKLLYAAFCTLLLFPNVDKNTLRYKTVATGRKGDGLSKWYITGCPHLKKKKKSVKITMHLVNPNIFHFSFYQELENNLLMKPNNLKVILPLKNPKTYAWLNRMRRVEAHVWIVPRQQKCEGGEKDRHLMEGERKKKKQLLLSHSAGDHSLIECETFHARCS